jgi:hypothetical protein
MNFCLKTEIFMHLYKKKIVVIHTANKPSPIVHQDRVVNQNANQI